MRFLGALPEILSFSSLLNQLCLGSCCVGRTGKFGSILIIQRKIWLPCTPNTICMALDRAFFLPLFILTRITTFCWKESWTVNYYEIKACMTIISVLFGHYACYCSECASRACWYERINRKYFFIISGTMWLTWRPGWWEECVYGTRESWRWFVRCWTSLTFSVRAVGWEDWCNGNWLY